VTSDELQKRYSYSISVQSKSETINAVVTNDESVHCEQTTSSFNDSIKSFDKRRNFCRHRNSFLCPISYVIRLMSHPINLSITSLLTSNKSRDAIKQGE
jgi:hypothetical protein